MANAPAAAAPGAPATVGAAAPSGAASPLGVPGPGFPGPTAEASHAAWPGGRQPAPLERWPTSADGVPGRCWKTSVLQDMHLGWPGKCHDLTRTSADSALECHETCTRDPLCSVWQYNYMTQCWHGVGRGCGEAEWQGSDLLATGAQRLQHGDVVVWRRFAGWQIWGLHDIGDTAYGTGNNTLGEQGCRAWCYSSVRCQYWQYAPGRCFVEDPGMMVRPVAYPLTIPAGATQATKLARTIIAGEFISHVCPAPPATAEAADYSISVEASASLELFLDAVVVLLLVLAFVRMWLRMRGYRRFLPGGDSPRTIGTPGSSSSPFIDGVTRKYQSTLIKTGDAAHTLLPAPIQALFLPTCVESLIYGHFASSAEQIAVRKVFPEAPLPFVNYLALRRTCTAALLLVGIVSYVMQLRVLYSTWRHRVYFQAMGHDPIMESYRTWVASNPANPSFLEYSRLKVLTLLAGVLGEVLGGAFLVDLLVCILELGPLVWLTLALLQWTTFSGSRGLVLRAWAAAFLSAFVVSLVPVRLMLSFAETERQADEYVHELAVAMNLDKAQKFILGSCEEISGNMHLHNQMELVGKTLGTTCRNLGRFPLHLVVPCIGGLDLCHVNLADALSGCREAVQQFEVGHVERALRILQRQCQRMREAFISPSTQPKRADQPGGRSQAFETLVNMMRMPLHAIVPSVELVSLTVSALHSMVMVLPQVLGIAPGFMAAGFTAKVLAPHEPLPGAVIIIVPIVIASVGWLAAAMVFQYISNPWVFLLTMVVVGYPLVYIWIGMQFRVTTPTDLETLRRGARTSTLTNAALALAVAFLLPLALKDLGAGPEHMSGIVQLMEWCHVTWARLGCACAARTLYSFTLTCFGAANWMISDIALQQRYWRFWSELGAFNSGFERKSKEEESLSYPLIASRRWIASSPQATPSMAMDNSIPAEEYVEVGPAEHEAVDDDVADLLRHRVLCRDANAARTMARTRLEEGLAANSSDSD